MKRILFVCSGNMYRSPGAEFILRKKLADEGISEWEVDSAGTLELGQISRPEDFGRIMAEHGYDFGGRTKYVYSADADKANIVLVMESQHQYVLRGIMPEENWNRIHTFMSFCFGSSAVLMDPSGYFSDDIYRETRDILEKGCNIIIEKIKAGAI